MTEILYRSTRNKDNIVTASEAILKGLADDGGLFVPIIQPQVALDFSQLQDKTYQEIALLILSAYYSDYTEEELNDCLIKAYNNKFDTPEIAPIVQKGSDYYLELFHGPTIAFKDLALSILPYLMTTAAKKQKVENDLVILTATSGDTGKAAMAGFADVSQTKIIVFYPKNGVSKIQERQMVTQEGDNTFVVSVDGNFDDAQSKVKELFNDVELRRQLANKNMQFSSANSINIGRLIPQVVYYVYAYAQLVKQNKINNGQLINVTVPTGNFGNILAAHYAKLLGVPLNVLVCASNTNNILSDFFASGTYDRNREFHVTTSPSMDILISSNLERLLDEVLEGNETELVEKMSELAKVGLYSLDDGEKEKLNDFYANFATTKQTSSAIKAVFEKSGYVLDPHTAVAKHVADRYRQDNNDSQTPMLIVATASPYKFPEAVVQAITTDFQATDEFEWIHELSKRTETVIPEAVTSLQELPIRHTLTTVIPEMKSCVKSILSI